MKQGPYFKFILFLFLCVNVTLLYSQSSSNSKEYYTWFDSVIGEGNTSLYNGVIYIEKYRTEKGNHKFFLSNEYQVGDLIYDNQHYYNVLMKYDTYEDELIVKLPNQSSHLFIKLVKEKINEFSIKKLTANLSTQNHRFIINSSFKNNKEGFLLSFYKVINKTASITLLKKHHKNRREYMGSYGSLSKFSEKNYFAILYENVYYRIDSKKDLTRLFPDYKKNISAFYKKERKLYRADKETFFTNLVKDINTFITKTDAK